LAISQCKAGLRERPFAARQRLPPEVCFPENERVDRTDSEFPVVAPSRLSVGVSNYEET
jgi:hypothetical protein